MTIGRSVAWAMLAACTPALPRSVARVVEPVSVPAPPLPQACPDAQYDAQPIPQTAQHTLVLFTSEWCTACDRVLEQLTDAASDLRARDVAVLHVITQTQGSCFAAARLGRRVPFHYAAIDEDGQTRWAVRSTPTAWLLGPQGQHTVRYVEGAWSISELWDWIDAAL